MIDFNRPALVGNELKYIQVAVAQGAGTDMGAQGAGNANVDVVYCEFTEV